jgi:hypothetical protein
MIDSESHARHRLPLTFARMAGLLVLIVGIFAILGWILATRRDKIRLSC